MSQDLDSLVSEQLDLGETIAAMAKKKATVNDGSGLQSMEEQMKILDQRSEEFCKEVFVHLEMQNQQFHAQKEAQEMAQTSRQALQQQMAQMMEMLQTLSTSTAPKVHQSIPISVPPVPVAAEGRQRHINLGSANIETQTKTHHGSTNNDSRGDRADIWYQGWQAQTRSSDWGKFSEELCRRFGELAVEDVVEEFNKLKQKNSVLEYQEKFEELKSLMLKYHPWLDEHYFVSSFISGLGKELRPLQLNVLTGVEAEEEEVKEGDERVIESENVEDSIEISLHAIEGIEAANSLKIRGEVNGKQIMVWLIVEAPIVLWMLKWLKT
ncbi:conserved hypothetical protein [Ricinus communis]|uniref:Uncharacterized protein n=1 Tax=Ricinus communis TaxID=3988 RepID=B9RMX5_RICCO|nr:conserved hypothetical protein [Ricinus communis]